MKKKVKTRDDRIEELEYDLNDANETIDEYDDFINNLYDEDILDDNDIDIIQNNDKSDDFER